MIQAAIDKILFLDIETVPLRESLDELSDALQHLWTDKFELLRQRQPEKYKETETAAEGFAQGAGVYAEFARIVCISVGFIHFRGNTPSFRVKSFAGDDEKQLLSDFSTALTRFVTTGNHYICGHNIKEFDIPFICRRMLVNALPLPTCIDVVGKKPWETAFLDTLEMWKFGDYKSFTSLKLLTEIFGIPTPKDDIDGSQVATVYYKEKDISRIAVYCEKDVVATAQLYLKMNGLNTIETDRIEHV